MINHALSYAASGWHVLPLWWPESGRCACGTECGATAKHPIAALCPNGLKNASIDEAVIRRWWGRFPAANIGIATGSASGLVVIDIDPRHGGHISLEELERHVGQLEAPTVATGGGGQHLYYAYPDTDVASRSGSLGAGLDLKARGGYVVAPPSIHASGAAYEWSIDIEDCPLVPLPAKVVDLAASPAAQVVADDDGMIPSGERNTRLFGMGGAIRRHGASFESIEQLLLDQNAARCVPPLTSGEVRRIAASCARYSPVDPALLNPHGLVELWERAEAPGAEEYCVSCADYAGDEPPGSEAEDFWIQGLVPKSAPIVIAGPPKSAKSLFTLDMAIALARGEAEFLGQGCTRAKVMFLPLEDPKNTTRRRLWQLCAGRGIHPRELDGWLAIDSDYGFYFDQPRFIGALRRAMDKFEPDVIVVDSLARAFGGDENSKEALSRALGPWQDIVRETKVTLAAIHHFRKSTVDSEGNPLPLGLRLRGSGDLFAFVRQVVGVSSMGPRFARCSQVETSGNYETQVEPFAFSPSVSDAPDGWPSEGRHLEYLGPVASLAPRRMDPKEAAIHELLSAEPQSGAALRTALAERGFRVSHETVVAMATRLGAERLGGGRSSVWQLRRQ